MRDVPALPQHTVHIHADGLARGKEPHEQCGGERHAEREEQDAHVQRDLVHARNKRRGGGTQLALVETKPIIRRLLADRLEPQTISTGTSYLEMIGSLVATHSPCSRACATMTRSNGSR